METIKGSVHTVGNGKEIIPLSQLNELGSISATGAAPTVSKKYSFISTMSILNILAKKKWLPVLAQERNSRKNAGFQKHLIRLRNKEMQPLKKVKGELFPEIILLNAHNAKGSYSMRIGIFRLACLNGLIVSDAMLGGIYIRHIGFEEGEIIEATEKLVLSLPDLGKRINFYQSILLDRKDQIAFAERALEVRYQRGDKPITHDDYGMLIGKRAFSTTQILTPLRKEDEKATLWNTFNIIQEKISKGSDFGVKDGYLKSTRPITGVNRVVKFNRDLWDLMEETAQQY